MSSRGRNATLTARLDKAMSERDAWKASGIQEKYLEAYSLVEALELLLEQEDGKSRESRAEDDQTLPESDKLLGQPQSLSEGDLPEAANQCAHVMSEFSISFNGRYYHYRGYRYDRLCDAVNYAILQASRAGGSDTGDAGLADEQRRLAPEEIVPPGESELRLMSSLAITFRNGTYFFGPYRYDCLSDAVRYARLLSASSQ